jgi:3'(2'), 5'-bisphosphate nucleotidase
MTNSAEERRLLDAACEIAREAGRAILEVYGRDDFAVSRKSDDSPLTEADQVAHRIISAALEKLDSRVPILSEESAPADPAVRRKWKRYWLVDPLDGTKEFLKRNGEFTVNIALIDNGVVVLSVVQAPVTGALWHAQLGRGAFRRDGDDDVVLRTRVPALAPLRVAGSRSHRDPRTQALMDRLGDIQVEALGSSLKFCRLAEGGMDVYPRFGPTSEWDTAAGQCVLEAAGGVVIDPRGRPLRYNQRDTILNGDFLALGDPQLPWREWLADESGK